ncbi:hypothetical protein F5Y17DRAFT_442492 [Xylariaceae sp. FL0594]|nr:hypothetical protein F5Y17DRAFT_442492 [Xylariaceae sp. FL0594]
MNMPPNYAMGGGMPMAGFPMQHGMTPQQQQQQQHHHMMMQRMQASQTNSNISTPTPQRHFQPQPSQGTPTPINGQMLPQAQFPGQSNAQGPLQGQTNTTQPQSQPQMQTSAQAPIQAQASPINVQTPQTPTFPTQSQGNGANGTSAGSTPVSPGADPRDKERVGIILEINNELLLEAMQIQSTQYIIKKERGNEGNANNGDKKAPEEELLTQDYIQCMRRLQTNLSYLAALADKERKPAQQSQPHPLYLKAPTLNTNVRLRQAQDGSEAKTDAPDREETAKYLAELYKKLQALFPDVDPNKEPGNTRPPGQGPNMNQSGSQTPGHASPVPGKQPTPTPATSAPPHFIAMGAPAS